MTRSFPVSFASPIWSTHASNLLRRPDVPNTIAQARFIAGVMRVTFQLARVLVGFDGELVDDHLRCGGVGDRLGAPFPVFFCAFSFSEAASASRCCFSYSRIDLPIESAIWTCEA